MGVPFPGKTRYVTLEWPLIQLHDNLPNLTSLGEYTGGRFFGIRFVADGTF